MAKRKDINPNGELAANFDEVKVVSWIFEKYLAGNSLREIAVGLEKQGIPPPADPNGIGGDSQTNCSPMKNTLGVCYSKRRSVLAQFRLKMMASWVGISTPVPMRSLFPMRYSHQSIQRAAKPPCHEAHILI